MEQRKYNKRKRKAGCAGEIKNGEAYKINLTSISTISKHISHVINKTKQANIE